MFSKSLYFALILFQPPNLSQLSRNDLMKRFFANRYTRLFWNQNLIWSKIPLYDNWAMNSVLFLSCLSFAPIRIKAKIPNDFWRGFVFLLASQTQSSSDLRLEGDPIFRTACWKNDTISHLFIFPPFLLSISDVSYSFHYSESLITNVYHIFIIFIQ